MKEQEEIDFIRPEGAVTPFTGTVRNLYEAIQRETTEALHVSTYLLTPIIEKVSWSIL